MRQLCEQLLIALAILGAVGSKLAEGRKSGVATWTRRKHRENVKLDGDR